MFPLIVEGALTRRRGKVLVGPVDLQLEADGVTIVIGPNGAGKTSLLRMLHGIARLCVRRQVAFVTVAVPCLANPQLEGHGPLF